MRDAPPVTVTELADRGRSTNGILALDRPPGTAIRGDTGTRPLYCTLHPSPGAGEVVVLSAHFPSLANIGEAHPPDSTSTQL